MMHKIKQFQVTLTSLKFNLGNALMIKEVKGEWSDWCELTESLQKKKKASQISLNSEVNWHQQQKK